MKNKGILIFPYIFVNDSNIPLNYIGKIPSKDMFSNISNLEYSNYIEKYKSENWSLRDETINYCEQDVKTLYQIIEKFNIRIFNYFRIDIIKYPTLSSIAFEIYRSNFLLNAKIPLIEGQIYN